MTEWAECNYFIKKFRGDSLGSNYLFTSVTQRVSVESNGKFEQVGRSLRHEPTADERKYLPVLFEGIALTDTAKYENESFPQNNLLSWHNETPKMRVCLQYFRSVKQLRISVFGIKGLTVKQRRLITKVSLLGSKGQKKRQYSSKNTSTNSSSAVFNENIYLELNAEDFSTSHLMIRLCEISNRRWFRKSTSTIGGVVLCLDGLNVDMDTAIDMQLTSPEQHRKVIDGPGMKVSRDDTLEEQVRKSVSKSESDYTPERSRSINTIKSLPVFIQFGPRTNCS